jgi:hypothetical protein
MKTKLYKITLIFLVLIISGSTFAQKNLLYVGALAHASGSDTAMTVRLTAKEYVVTFVDQGEYEANYKEAAAYSAYDVILFDEAMGSGNTVPLKNAGFPIPCVCLEGYSVRDNNWGMLPEAMYSTNWFQGGSASTDVGINTLIIDGVNNWIAEQYEYGYELVWSNNPSTSGVTGFNLDGYVDGAIELGRYKLDEFANLPSVWAIPSGSTILSDNSTVYSNLVIIGSIASGMGQPTDEFIDFIDICIKWVTDEYEYSGTVSNVQSSYLSVYPNPTNGIVNISLTLPASGNARVNIYDIAGKLMKTIDTDNLSAGDNTISLDISGLAEAQYIYEIITKNNVLRGKICKN